MTVTAISLVDPGSGASVAIMPADGVAAQVLDVAAPARAVTADRSGAHGTFDTTAYSQAAAVSLSLLLYPTATAAPETFLDTIAPLLSPALRPVLVVSNDAWAGPRQITVRYDSISKPLSDPTNWPVQITWAGPSAVWEDATALTAVIGAFTATDTGLTWGITGIVWTSAGVVWPASTSPPPSIVTNPGTIGTQWTAQLYGPCTGPKLASDTTGGALEFTDDLTLAAGEYVLLDSAGRTAYRNGDAAQPVIGSLTFPAGWFLLQPGANNLRYYPTSAGPASAAQLTWRPARPA